MADEFIQVDVLDIVIICLYFVIVMAVGIFVSASFPCRFLFVKLSSHNYLVNGTAAVVSVAPCLVSASSGYWEPGTLYPPSPRGSGVMGLI